MIQGDKCLLLTKITIPRVFKPHTYSISEDHTKDEAKRHDGTDLNQTFDKDT